MTQNSTAQFTVGRREKVRVRVRALETALFCSAALDGETLTAASQTPTVYEFAISRNSGEEQEFDFTGAFDAAAPGTAHYELYVAGDEATEYQGPWYQLTDLGAPITLRFEVAQ